MPTMIDILDGGPRPKRGDIVQTNVGNPRERTWMILRARQVKRCSRRPQRGIPRFDVWMARWWELESDFRLRLFRSADRAGGQNVIYFRRYPVKKRNKLVIY